MTSLDKFNTVHLDILKEIGNIGAGHAATALSKLLNKKVDMKVPNVKIVSFDEMMDLAGGPETLAAAVYLRIDGELSGSMFFVLPTEQATMFIRHMINNEDFLFEQLQNDELATSALQELGNILSGSYLSSLSDFTGLSLYPSVPALSVDMVGAMISYGLIELSHSSDFAIVIDTAFHNSEQVQESVKGHFFLLPNPESFSTLFHALGVQDHD